MKYTIELTDKQRKRLKHMNKALIKMGMGFDILSLLEPIKTTNVVEDTNEYQIGYKVGFEDGKANVTYNIGVIDKLKQVEYNKGLEDAKTYIVKLYSYGIVEMEKEFDETTIPDIIANNPMTDIIAIIKAYEEKKKAEEDIRVGDIIYSELLKSSAIITRDSGMLWGCIDTNGIGFSKLKDRLDEEWVKVGHTDELSHLFDKLRGTKIG